MFDIGWDELLLIALVALVVIGPKDLPGVLRTLGQWVARARSLAGEFRAHVDDMIREAGVDDMKNEFTSMANPSERKEIEDNLMIGNPPSTEPKKSDEDVAPEVRDVPEQPADAARNDAAE
ncbi:MAG: twin-arginine translocase subunit TatB [Alphaproteobacteria bacterium]|nr:twin-arginine translocase subunit TatB [Alphaproteobacteria bacterium]